MEPEYYKIKIQSDEEFLEKLAKLNLHLNQTNNNSTLFEKEIKKHFDLVSRLANKSEKNKWNQISFSNVLPFLELEGGYEFFESEIGKEAIDILFYFAYKYKLE
jgi:hypothetical protein